MWFVLQSSQRLSQTCPRCWAARSASRHAFSKPQNSPRELPVRSPSLTATKSTARKVPVSSCSTKPCDPSLCSRRHVLITVTIAHVRSQETCWPVRDALYAWTCSSDSKSSLQLTIPLSTSDVKPRCSDRAAYRRAIHLEKRTGHDHRPQRQRQPLSGQRCAERRARPTVRITG